MTQNAFFSPTRISIIAGHTFTQLMRMKVFYFLVIFAIAMLALSFFEMPWSRSTADTAEQELITLKSAAMGGMSLFSMLFAITSTALLIPKDIEDRTLYTILSKPVPRLDYLIGKLIGVIILVALSLIAMDALLSLILYTRTESLVATETLKGEAQNWPQGYMDARLNDIRQQGVTWGLQAGIGAIFFKGCIIATIALLISTVSSSTLFTIITAVIVYFMGHFTADARSYWLHSQDASASSTALFISQAASLILPDFQIFNIVDATIKGEKVSFSIFSRIGLLTLFYVGIYTVLTWFTFRKKEF